MSQVANTRNVLDMFSILPHRNVGASALARSGAITAHAGTAPPALQSFSDHKTSGALLRTDSRGRLSPREPWSLLELPARGAAHKFLFVQAKSHMRSLGKHRFLPLENA